MHYCTRETPKVLANNKYLTIVYFWICQLLILDFGQCEVATHALLPPNRLALVCVTHAQESKNQTSCDKLNT